MIRKIGADSVEPWNGVTGRAIQSGQTVIAKDLRNNPAYQACREFTHKYAIVSAMSLPLKAGNKLLGALTVYSHSALTFTQDENGVI